jgi:hypothetical protein
VLFSTSDVAAAPLHTQNEKTPSSCNTASNNNMASTGPTGGSSPLHVATRGAFVVPRTGRLFEIAPLGKAGAVVLLSAVVSAALMFGTVQTLTPRPASHSPDFRRRADARGPVADRVAANPIFLNPMRNRIPGHSITPDDARKL